MVLKFQINQIQWHHLQKIYSISCAKEFIKNYIWNVSAIIIPTIPNETVSLPPKN